MFTEQNLKKKTKQKKKTEAESMDLHGVQCDWTIHEISVILRF